MFTKKSDSNLFFRSVFCEYGLKSQTDLGDGMATGPRSGGFWYVRHDQTTFQRPWPIQPAWQLRQWHAERSGQFDQRLLTIEALRKIWNCDKMNAVALGCILNLSFKLKLFLRILSKLLHFNHQFVSHEKAFSRNRTIPCRCVLLFADFT